jgi:FtsP/CotA-like multicopper oxidase with cupredoxin domain
MKLSRRDALKFAGLAALGTAGLSLPLGRSVSGGTPSLLSSGDFPKRFARPFEYQKVLTPTPKFDGDKKIAECYDLRAKAGYANILPFKKTPVLGYDAIVPGHRIDVERYMPVELTMRNELTAPHPVYGKPVKISTHLHGSASLPQYDGYANDTTAPGQLKVYKYPNHQPARTMWYHDHGAHYTAQNAYSGLAAQYHVHDDLERKLLPTYQRAQGAPDSGTNKYDVAITLSDMMFKADGSQLYDDRSFSGLWGDVILVNGVPWPNMVVEPRVYRFRVLNASISRSYKLTLSPAAKLHMVATDGGLMPARQEVSSYRHAPAERYEFLIDFAPFAGQKVELRNLSNPNNRDFDYTHKVMQFTVSAAGTAKMIGPAYSTATMPSALNADNEVMKVTASQSVKTRRIKVEKSDVTNEWELNDETWHDVEAPAGPENRPYSKVIANPKPGTVEIWEIENSSGGWFHPLHIHLIDFKILTRNGRAAFAYEQGPKDVVYIGEGETVRLLIKFPEDAKGKYMVHCHNLPHEDHDMMHQFSVGLPTTVVDGKIYVTGYDEYDPIETAKPTNY